MSSASSQPWRIAMCGLASENCTFSPSNSTLEDFRILQGDAQLERYPFLADGFEGAEFLPLYYGRALPGGMIESDSYARLKTALLASLETALPVDAIYLDLHGAMNVVGMDDAEGDLVQAVRALVGSEVLLGASMDLHGNVSESLVNNVNLFSAYRTAPHIDTVETRRKVCRLLLDCLKNGWRPVRAWIPIPVLLPGEMTSTLDEPGISLYAGLTDFDDEPGLLDVSLWVGYVWADERRAHACVVATGLTNAVTQRVAETVAARYWDARSAFRFNVPFGTLEECLDRAIRESVKPVVISDSGDNPTAGGVGNLPYALRQITHRALFVDGTRKVLIVGIWDADSVRACAAAGIDAEVKLSVGRSSDPQHGGACAVSGVVKRFFDDDRVAGLQVVLEIGKGITVVLTERRKPFHEFRDFNQLGLDPYQFDIVVVKIGYLVPDLEKLAASAYLALTPGAVDQHITRVDYKHLERPMFPFDPEMAWTPQAKVV